MSITIRKYNNSDLKSWYECVKNFNNVTMLHLRKFLGYLPEKSLNKIKSNYRITVSKAEKYSIQIRLCEDFTSFFIFELNISIRHNVKPAHTLEEIQLSNNYCQK